ncbi:MAG: hypothetical protein HQL87_09920 [Magnetococcales bacterium]|nr:hypothetical protein [Magnetococcales bacterium]
MPLSNIQSDVFRLLASQRDPESYVAGSSPLNRNNPRFSGDMDLFHDREERVARAYAQDSALLRTQGFELQELRREPTFYAVLVQRGAEVTKIEWVVDSDFRFFPTIRDELFGYVLHPIDLATNKVSAATGRREPRDVVDLVTIHAQVLPLGAVIWAAAGKSVGFTPEGIINEIRRLARYTAADFRRVASDPPVDPDTIMRQLRLALDEAETFVLHMPTDKIGLLFLKNGTIVQPDPDRLADYQTHAGQRRGQWPSSPGLFSAMFEHYNGDPPC